MLSFGAKTPSFWSPLPEERPEAPKNPETPKEPEASQDLDGLMFLPRAEFTTYSASAETIFKRICRARATRNVHPQRKRRHHKENNFRYRRNPTEHRRTHYS